MKKLIFGLFVLALAACGPASRDNAGGDGVFWLMKDGQAQLCVQELRNRGVIGISQQVFLYPDSVNIYAIRQSNPSAYSATETEFKNTCRSIGIIIDGSGGDGSPKN